MKRLISGVLALILLITSLSACSKKPTTDDEYNINDYKDGAGLSGLLGEEQTGEDGNSSQGSSGGGGSQTPNKPNTNKNESPSGNSSSNPNDVDTDELDSSSTASKNDTTSTESSGLPYADNVKANINYTEITSGTYDESKLKLPCVRIETLDGNAITSRTEYKNATIEIDNTIKSFAKNKSAVEVRGRGNSTWTVMSKKAYKLKFAINTNLFGMGDAKKYVLLANALDETMLRNSIAFDLAKTLDVSYSTDYRFVNLFVNGKYQGVYQLCEQMEEGNSRVDVNSSKTGETNTGYLVEFYGAGDVLKDKTFRIPKVNGKHLQGAEPDHQFVIKSPGAKTATEAQVEYIKEYIIKANEAIFSGDYKTFAETCDVDSFVNMFLVDEIMLNNDMGYSFYMYKKKDGKLYLGPAWDFDQSCGNSSHGGTTYKGWYAGSPHAWYLALIEMPEFRAKVKARYNQKKGDLKAIIEGVDKTINTNSFDFAMSNYNYNSFGSRSRWRTMKEIYSMTTYSQHVSYLKTWLTNRFIWMEDQFKGW